MTDLATLQARLAEAETAQHKLLTGTQVASVNYEGQGQVTYSKADLPALASYIASLRSQIAAASGQQGPQLRPIGLTF